jgi:hypothetical protein
MTRCGGYHWVTRWTKGATGCPVTPRPDGAGDRNRTGDVQLGNFLTVVSRNVTSYQNSSFRARGPSPGPHALSFLLTSFGQHLGQQGAERRVTRPSRALAPQRRRPPLLAGIAASPPDRPEVPCNAQRATHLTGRAEWKGQSQERGQLLPRPIKVPSNLRRDLAIRHLVDRVNPHDALAEPLTLKMVFEFDLGLTRA